MDGNSNAVNAIVETLSAMFPDGAALHEPEIAGNEWKYVKECLDSGWVSSVGSHVDRFEGMLADVTGAADVAATVNGTAALHACLELAGVEVGDEVIVPALSFVAPANAVSYLGAVPHFADADPTTLGLDPAKLDAHLTETADVSSGVCVNTATGRVIRAAICVHGLGHPADMDVIASVCERHALTLIEDAAESLGSTYKDVHTGNRGRLAALSFNGNKIVTTGGGGAVLTNDPGLGARAKHLTTTAKVPHTWRYQHDAVGFNYRLPNVNAAIGCAQLERLEDSLQRKRQIAEAYREAFVKVPGIVVFEEPAHGKSNYWLNALVLDAEFAGQRDDILDATNRRNLQTRPLWEPLHTLAMFADGPRMDLSVTEDLHSRVVCVPSGAALAEVISSTHDGATST